MLNKHVLLVKKYKVPQKLHYLPKYNNYDKMWQHDQKVYFTRVNN